jgi:DNA polymerase (family 10)
MDVILEKANELGYEYIAFTEHNPSQKGHNEQDFVEILKRKKEKVDKLNGSLGKKSGSCKKVFNSLEIDILPDGSLPVSDKAMETLDFALISIHSGFNYGKRKMTERVLRAFSHPKSKIFAHPTGRKLNERESIELDWEKIFEFCKVNKKWVEINADPMRLDLPDFLVKEALESGVKLTMGTDSHYVVHMDNMKYAVYVARRGWAEKEDIINTCSLNDFEKMIK